MKIVTQESTAIPWFIRIHVALNEAIQDKINKRLLYVFYVTIVIMRNVCVQQLAFLNSIFSQDSCCSVKLGFIEKIASGMISKCDLISENLPYGHI